MEEKKSAIVKVRAKPTDWAEFGGEDGQPLVMISLRSYRTKLQITEQRLENLRTDALSATVNGGDGYVFNVGELLPVSSGIYIAQIGFRTRSAAAKFLNRLRSMRRQKTYPFSWLMKSWLRFLVCQGGVLYVETLDYRDCGDAIRLRIQERELRPEYIKERLRRRKKPVQAQSEPDNNPSPTTTSKPAKKPDGKSGEQLTLF